VTISNRKGVAWDTGLTWNVTGSPASQPTKTNKLLPNCSIGVVVVFPSDLIAQIAMHGLDIHVRTIGPTPFPTTTTNLLKVQPPTNVLQRCLRTSGPVRIVLIGPPKSGKSSFVGSACTVLSDRSAVDHQLSTFPTTQVLHILLPGTDIVLTDTWAVTDKSYRSAELSCLLSGNIPHGFARPRCVGSLFSLSMAPPITGEVDAVAIFVTAAAVTDEGLSTQLMELAADVRAAGTRLHFVVGPDGHDNENAVCEVLGAKANEIVRVTVYQDEVQRSMEVERQMLAALLEMTKPNLRVIRRKPPVPMVTRLRSSTKVPPVTTPATIPVKIQVLSGSVLIPPAALLRAKSTTKRKFEIENTAPSPPLPTDQSNGRSDLKQLAESRGPLKRIKAEK